MIENEPFREGIVSSVDKKKCTARVYFEDLDDSVSHDLKVLVRNSMSAKTYWMPEVGEAVLCMFLESGIETGYIVGSFYSEADKPPSEISEDDKDREGIWLEDGSFIKYEHESNTLVLDIKNEINIHAGGVINIIADNDIEIVGNVNVTGDVVASGISLVNHTHACPHGETSPPS